MKPTRERLQSRADWPGSLPGRPPPVPTGQWPLHTASSCQVHSRSDLFWWNSNFPCNFMKCSNLAHIFLKSNKTKIVELG
jgi:hypothetical protein